MKIIFEIFISDASYVRPSRLDPPLLSYTDLLIGVAALVVTVGTVVLFRFLYRKWKVQKYNRSPSGTASSLKKDLTQYEKHTLAQKIRETRTNNLKKSFAGEDNSNYMIFATIGLIVIALLWLLHAISKGFKPY